MEIRVYQRADDEINLMKIIENEGKDWSSYTSPEGAVKYKAALENSITYVAYEGETLCGYSRSIDDCGFCIYICDLLVMCGHRGKGIGRKLMECIYEDYPKHELYVMSDVDEYYQKQGYRREGSIFGVTNRNIAKNM